MSCDDKIMIAIFLALLVSIIFKLTLTNDIQSSEDTHKPVFIITNTALNSRVLPSIY